MYKFDNINTSLLTLMDKICDSAKFYSNIGLNYIVAKIMNSERKKGRNRREMFTFFTMLIHVKLFKRIGFCIIYFGLWEGGGASAGGG